MIEDSSAVNIEFQFVYLTNFIAKVGMSLVLFYRALRCSPQIFKRRNDFVHQLYRAVIGTLGVTMIVALFIGMILSLQTGIQLAAFQQQSQVGIIFLRIYGLDSVGVCDFLSLFSNDLITHFSSSCPKTL